MTFRRRQVGGFPQIAFLARSPGWRAVFVHIKAQMLAQEQAQQLASTQPMSVYISDNVKVDLRHFEAVQNEESSLLPLNLYLCTLTLLLETKRSSAGNMVETAFLYYYFNAR